MNNRINLSLSEDTLARLIREGHLCAADLGFLDTIAKQKVWQLCLWCCKRRCLDADFSFSGSATKARQA